MCVFVCVCLCMFVCVCGVCVSTCIIVIPIAIMVICFCPLVLQDAHIDRIMATLVGSRAPGTSTSIKDVILPGMQSCIYIAM